MKPFTIAAALESGQVTPATTIQTAPGRLTIGKATIHDAHAEGLLTVAQIIQKSSNPPESCRFLCRNSNNLQTFK